MSSKYPFFVDSCGEKPANLLLKFIGLEFSSFETLYRQLGFHSPLPVSCRTLIKHAMATDQSQIQKPFSRATAKFYKFYLHNNDRRHSSPFPFLILILNFSLSIIFIIFSIWKMLSNKIIIIFLRKKNKTKIKGNSREYWQYEWKDYTFNLINGFFFFFRANFHIFFWII